MLNRVVFMIFSTLVIAIAVVASEREDVLILKNLERYQKEGKIQGVELLVTTPSKRNLFGSFGHVSLRFVTTYHNWMNDPVLSFVAETSVDGDSKFKKAVKLLGLLPKYPLELQVETMGSLWMRVSGLDDRNLQRFVLPANQIIIKKLIESFLKFKEKTNARYSFLTSNCASELSQTLVAAGVGTGFGTISPTKMNQYFQTQWVAIYPSESFEVMNQKDVVSKLMRKLREINQDKIEVEWPSNIVLFMESNFSDSEIKLINLLYGDTMPWQERAELMKRHNFAHAKTLDEIVGVAKLPDELYQLVSDENSASKTLQKLLQVYGQSEIRHQINDWRKNLQIKSTSTNHRTRYSSQFMRNSSYVKHINLLIKVFDEQQKDLL